MKKIQYYFFLVLIAAVIHQADFPAGLLNWYLVSVFLVLVGMVILWVKMG